MATTMSHLPQVPNTSRTSSNAGSAYHNETANGHPPPLHASRMSDAATATAPVNTVKKAKNKKIIAPDETEKLVAAKISQLELNKTGERGEEEEISEWSYSGMGMHSC